MTGPAGMLSGDPHQYFMRLALAEAEKARDAGEVPVGAVIVHDGSVIGRAHNQRETLKDPTAHAEMLALTQASAALERWRLFDTVMYVTLEPCTMCAGAIVLARVPTLVFGAPDPKAGACGTLYNVVQDSRLNHCVELVPGVLEDECRYILQRFFAERREKEQDRD